jgi:hypothetical protein
MICGRAEELLAIDDVMSDLFGMENAEAIAWLAENSDG